MTHESRLTAEVRRLLGERRSAALATIDPQGDPHVSMVPVAVEPSSGRLVLLVSGLAAHTGHMKHHARVSLLITDHEREREPVHALSRLTINGEAHFAAREGAEFPALQSAYLRRFPEAEPIAQLPDFRYVGVYVRSVRQVAGFGAARNINPEDFQRLLQSL